MKRSLLCVVWFVALPSFVNAGEALPADLLQKLKSATVFIKADAGNASSVAYGSGFVFKIDGRTALVATNSHLFDPILVSSVITSGTKSNPTFKSTMKSAPIRNVKVVFDSGTKNERTYDGEILAADKKRDVAVVRVLEVTSAPMPINLDERPALIETMTVFGFGFPFGEVLAGRKTNPAITVSRGSISSIRNEKKNESPRIQIDGAINPGNSGGPVVDAKGRLVGIVVSGVFGAGLSFALPPDNLTALLKGQIEVQPLAASKRDDGGTEVKVSVKLLDPLHKIQDVSFFYMPAEQWKETSPATLDEEGRAKKLTLKMEGQVASATFAVEALGEVGTEFSHQAFYVDADGRTVFSPRQTSLVKLKSLPKAKVDGAPTVAKPKPKATPTQDAQPLAEPVLAGYLAELKDTSFAKRSKAASALSLAKPTPEQRPDVLKALTALFFDSNPGVRKAGMLAYGSWATKENLPLILTYVDDKDTFMREAAVESLGKIKDPSTLNVILKKFQEASTRSSASKAFIAFGPDAEKTVMRALGDSSSITRREAVNVLKVIGTNESVSALETIVARNEPGSTIVQAAAREALTAIVERGKNEGP